MRNIVVYLILVCLITSTVSNAQLRDDKQYGLIWLHKNGYVRIKGNGQSITQIYPEIENLVNKRIKVVVRTGTYFVSSRGYQNMVTREESAFTLAPYATKSLAIGATCINANLKIPSERNKFHEVARVSDDLIDFLEASGNSDEMVVQAGVWAITDRYTAHQVKMHLVSVDSYGNRRQAVSDDDIAEARRILNKLGIRNRL